jgi:transcriptional regulator with XRE-family HTH domain
MSSRTVKPTLDRKLGRILREHRRQRGWTLETMSQRTGLAPSTLSKVENNQMSLSFDTLVRVADGLGISFEALFNPGGATLAGARRAVTRRGEGTRFATPQYDYVVHGAELQTKRMIPLWMKVKARRPEDIAELSRHVGEEYVYVVDGRVTVLTDQYAPLSLEAGESVYFDSGMGHGFLSESKQDATILSICWTAGAYRISDDRNSQPILIEQAAPLAPGTR